MNVSSYYPVVASSDVAGARRFYERCFGFTPGFEADWYVHLVNPDNPSVVLAIVDKDHESLPPEGRTPASGLVISFEVDDVDREHERLSKAGVTIVVPLRDEPWGQRHFIIDAPDGVLVDLITPIRPSTEYAADYQVDLR